MESMCAQCNVTARGAAFRTGVDLFHFCTTVFFCPLGSKFFCRFRVEIDFFCLDFSSKEAKILEAKKPGGFHIAGVFRIFFLLRPLLRRCFLVILGV